MVQIPLPVILCTAGNLCDHQLKTYDAVLAIHVPKLLVNQFNLFPLYFKINLN